MAQLRKMAGDSCSRKSGNGLQKTSSTRIVPAAGVASEYDWNRAGIEHRRGAAHNHSMRRVHVSVARCCEWTSKDDKIGHRARRQLV